MTVSVIFFNCFYKFNFKLAFLINKLYFQTTWSVKTKDLFYMLIRVYINI